MTTPAAERLVKYVLTMELDGAAQQNAAKLPKIVEQAQAEATKIVGQNTKERLEFEKTAFDRLQELQKKQLGAAEATHRELAGIAEMMQSQITKAAEAETQKREEIEKNSLRRIQEDYDKHVGIVQQKAREMNDGVTKAGEGVIKLGRGLATVGILQEETAEEMLRALIAVQAVVDLAKGGIEIYRGIQQAVDAYRASVVAATAAETALAAARGRTAGVTGIGGATQLAGTAGAGVAGAGVGGSLAPVLASLGAAITSLPGAIALAITGAVGVGAVAANVGGSRDWLRKQVEFTPEGAGGTFGLGSTWGAYSAGMEDFWHLRMGGEDDYATTARRRALESQERTERMQAERGAGLEMFERHNAAAQGQFDFQRRMEQMRRQQELSIEQMLGGPDLDTVHSRLGVAQNALQGTRQNLAQAEALPAGAMRQAEIQRASQAQIEALQRVIELRKQALSLEQQASAEAIQAAKQETAEIERQLELERNKKEQAEARYMSAKERFGMQDEETQRQTIAAMHKARSGQELSREELALLRGVGTEQAGEFARQGATALADAAGFDSVFGEKERAAIKASADEMMRLELELQTRPEVLVKLEADREALVQTVVDTIRPLLEQENELLRQDLLRKLDEEAANRNNAHGGRGLITGG